MVKLLPFSIEKMFGAVEAVQRRLMRATAAPNAAKIPYAVIGGHAVAAWVSRVDEGATRNTKDVNILLRREDLPAAKEALEKAGFVGIELLGVPMFLDGPDGKPSQAVHVLIAGEKVPPENVAPVPDISESEQMEHFPAVSLEALVRMKLTSNRDKDRTHIRDLIGVGLIDSTWPARFQPELAARLQDILDHPED